MDAKNGYCSAQLKQAKSLAIDGHYDSSINAVGKGIERLLKELFDELRNNDNSNLIALSVAYNKATSKKRWSRSKNGEKELNLYGWIKFYQDEEVGIFRKLEEIFGYEFNEFNGDNLHQIRINRNEYGAHADEQYDIHRKLSRKLIDLYSNMLSETGRIAQPSSIVPINKLRRKNNNQLALHPNEKSLLKQELDDTLRSNPDEIDALFLRAHLLRGENAALDDLERILILNPSHSEARKERIWNLNRLYSEEPASHQSSPHLTQVNISSQRNFFFISQVSSTIRNILPNTNILSNVNIFSENKFVFKPNINLFSIRISEKVARHIRDAVIASAIVFGVVVALVALLGLAVLDVLKDSPHLPGMIIILVVVLLWALTRRL